MVKEKLMKDYKDLCELAKVNDGNRMALCEVMRRHDMMERKYRNDELDSKIIASHQYETSYLLNKLLGIDFNLLKSWWAVEQFIDDLNEEECKIELIDCCYKRSDGFSEIHMNQYGIWVYEYRKEIKR